MDLICSAEVKKIKDARKHIDDLQRRTFRLESLLDDLSRAVEIARFSGQYNVVDVYTREAEEALKDRIVLPEIDQSNQKYTIVEGKITDEQWKAIGEARAAKTGKGA